MIDCVIERFSHPCNVFRRSIKSPVEHFQAPNTGRERSGRHIGEGIIVTGTKEMLSILDK